MNDPAHDAKMDTLRERLADKEYAQARRVLESGGIEALIRYAEDQLTKVATERARYDQLTRDVEKADPKARFDLMAAYIAQTPRSAHLQKLDIRALKKRKAGVMDMAALGERVARHGSDTELAAEVALALGASTRGRDTDAPYDVRALCVLANTPGRWSRRTAALDLLAQVVTRTTPEKGAQILALAKSLAVRTEHRWVQPAALAVVAARDPNGARMIALDRLNNPGDEDDMLVRERIIDMAAQGLFGRDERDDILTAGGRDKSDHVRLTVAKLDRDTDRLATMAHSDESPKVRAQAIITLSKRAGLGAEAVFIDALESDTSGFVVETAAEEVGTLAEKGRFQANAKLLGAVQNASLRADLSTSVRGRLAEALVRVAVLSSPLLRPVYDLLQPIVERTPVGGRTRLVGPALASLSDSDLGRILVVLAQNDFGLAVDRIPGGAILHRGEPRTFAAWRVIFEMRHPAPSKRQAFIHTWARRPAGRLRAPPGGLAELTATNVPGERVLINRAGGWGRHLPLVDDLISTTRLVHAAPVSIVTPSGTTTITAPKAFGARMRAWTRLTLKYASFVEMRRRALESEEPQTQGAYVLEVSRATGVTMTFTPHTFGRGRTTPAPVGLADHALPAAPYDLSQSQAQRGAGPGLFMVMVPAGITRLLDGIPGVSDIWRDFLAYAGSPQGNRLPDLAGYALVILSGMLVRSVVTRRLIERDRAAIPLSIGGWGTRGKSGTERLKAGMFQGLGYETLVKTTGCEAMFIHAMPGMLAREVFIYRPYDKATVWEQTNVLETGRRFGVRVFLWECMALQPDLVNLLQSQWMRDDYSTITNAYPNHEDVMGPTGFDVGTVISEFVPTKGRLFTSEDQMLPVIRERARSRETPIREITGRDAELIPDDLLKRFPYQEHPKNIALVAALAKALGIPNSLAIVEMADSVVPNLGVLKTYPVVGYGGRTLSFTNGMSANERTGALSNWKRTDFDKHTVDDDPARWIITVVNNRADRIARSEVFSRFLVEDIAAHRHFLIGTNVSGLNGFIENALVRHLDAIRPSLELAGSPDEKLKTAEGRVIKAFARLKIGRTDARSVQAELAALNFPQVDPQLLARLVEPADPSETYEAATSAVTQGLPGAQDEQRPFMIAAIARRRVARAFFALLARDLARDPAGVDRAFATTYRALFKESVIPLVDSSMTGDQIIDLIAKRAPPGARVTIQGVQNIKGTGLDFVYRWVSLDMVARYLKAVASAKRDEREQGLRDLTLHDDYGLVDARHALEKVTEARSKDPEAGSLGYDAVIARLQSVVDTRAKKLTATRKVTAGEVFRGFIGTTFDYLDSIRRQNMARALLTELVEGRVSHSAAAVQMRDIVARAKGGWMKRAT